MAVGDAQQGLLLGRCMSLTITTDKYNETLYAEKVNSVLLLAVRNVDGTHAVDLLLSAEQAEQLKMFLNGNF